MDWDLPAAFARDRKAVCVWGALWRGETRSMAKKVLVKALLAVWITAAVSTQPAWCQSWHVAFSCGWSSRAAGAGHLGCRVETSLCGVMDVGLAGECSLHRGKSLKRGCGG